MLRTMITDGPFEQKWVLQGRLCGQWAIDFNQRWQDSRSSRNGRTCIVDLEDVVCVDRDGEKALVQMAADGARLVSSRAYMKHLLETVLS